MAEQGPQYLLGVAIGFTVVPYFVLYLVFVLVTRRVIAIPYLLAGMAGAVAAAFVIDLLGYAWLGADVIKTPIPMFSGVLIAGGAIHLLGKWLGRPTGGG
ncbi:MAG TPA: hypothetical protein VKA55_01230 [Gammaproteobacteria bacterium]|nr:hypothetical protein [Gammaproteobacteria bacterium]